MALSPSFRSGNRPLARSVAWALAQREAGKADTSSQGAFAVNEREAREAMALSCGMIAMIDDAIGRVLDRLAACGLADNTIVIFNSDHGDFLGDHQLLLKAPLIMRPSLASRSSGPSPERGAARRTEMLSGTLDIAATILDRVKVQPYNGIQGISLLPVLEDARAVLPRDSMVIEDDQQRAIFGLPSGSRLRTLITQRHRMTIAQGDLYGELYDLQSDPHEMDNLFDDPAQRVVRADLMERLAYREMEFVDRSPLPMGRA